MSIHSEKNIAIEFKNVSKSFKIDDKSFRGVGNLKNLFNLLFASKTKRVLRVLKDINITIFKGETIGIIGKNGSGKSTLVKTMSGAYFPDSGGEIIKNGKSMLMTLKVGMNPELTARQNIYVNASALGLTIKEIDSLFDKIVEFAEVKDYIDTTTKNFSNGMLAKLAFSIAVNTNAEIMFLDEVFAVGDQSFRNKAIKAIEQNWLKGRTVIIVSHSLGLIKKYCDKVIYLNNGEVKYFGDPKVAIEKYNEDSLVV